MLIRNGTPQLDHEKNRKPNACNAPSYISIYFRPHHWSSRTRITGFDDRQKETIGIMIGHELSRSSLDVVIDLVSWRFPVPGLRIRIMKFKLFSHLLVCL